MEEKNKKNKAAIFKKGNKGNSSKKRKFSELKDKESIEDEDYDSPIEENRSIKFKKKRIKQNEEINYTSSDEPDQEIPDKKKASNNSNKESFTVLKVINETEGNPDAYCMTQFQRELLQNQREILFEYRENNQMINNFIEMMSTFTETMVKDVYSLRKMMEVCRDNTNSMTNILAKSERLPNGRNGFDNNFNNKKPGKMNQNKKYKNSNVNNYKDFEHYSNKNNNDNDNMRNSNNKNIPFAYGFKDK